MRKRLLALALVLTLLTGCTPPEAPAPTPTAPPTPEPTVRPTQLTFLHGFYATSSYDQIGLADHMDAVSLGWGRMYVDENGEPYVNGGPSGGNDWMVPQSPQLATDYLDARGIPYNLCVFATAAHSYGLTNVLEYIIRPGVRERTVAALVGASERYSGLTIDFEGLRAQGSREDFTAFMTLLRQELPGDKLLYAAVPPDLWYKGYDYRALGELCDKVILMAHDYQWAQAPEENLGTALTDTPCAPIGSVAAALERICDGETGVADKSKLVLAISFASAGVKVDEEGLLLGRRVYSPGPETLSRRLAQEDAQPGWSERYQSPWVTYHDEGGDRYLVWYEDARSVEAKIRLAYEYGVTGVSLWRLGSVPAFENYNVWETVKKERLG